MLKRWNYTSSWQRERCSAALSGFNQAERAAGFLTAAVEGFLCEEDREVVAPGTCQDLSAVLTICPSSLPSIVSTSRLFYLSCVLTRSSGAVIAFP